MKLVFASVLLMFFVTSSIGANCYYEGHKFMLGEKYAPPGLCSMLVCYAGGHIGVKICAKLLLPPSCKLIPRDDSKAYPECCERYDC